MLQDLRYAVRQLFKAPGFAAVAILTLALGIGANTAIFSVVQALLLSPLPYPDSGRIAIVFHSPTPNSRNIADGGTFLDWKEHATSFESLAAQHNADLNLSGVAEPAQLTGYAVSADYLRVFRIQPALGRDFTAEEDAAGGDNNVVILTHEMWQRRLSADPEILGKTIRLDGRGFTVIGVLAPNALNTPNIEFLIPAAIGAAEWKQQRNYNYVCLVFGRLKPGATFAQAQAELVAANDSLRSLYPPNKADWTVTVDPFQETVASGPRPYVLMLMATVALVLLIACANVANLLLARAATRQTEIAVRVALGASVSHIVRLLLVESSLLSLLGGAAGLLVASYAIGPLITFASAAIAPGLAISLNPVVLLFTLAVSLATGVLFGLAPALRIARPNLTNDLKESSRGTAGGARHRLQRAFIVTETGLTVVLLFTAGLLLRSFMATLGTDAGFSRDQILLFDLNQSSVAAPTPAHRVRFVASVLRELSAQPAIAAAGMISSAPFNNQRFYGDTIRRSEESDARADIRVGFDSVGGDLFQALGVPLQRGRFLTDADNLAGARKVLLVNQALARQLFESEDALGRHVRFKDTDWEIVGIVGNMSRAQLDAPPPPMVYLPVSEFPWTISIVVRTHGSPLTVADTVRRAVAAVDPDQPIANLLTMQQAIDNSFSVRIRRAMLILVGVFAAIALLLACVGLYGVMAYTVTQRTREIGVRIALGADSSDVLREVVRGGILLVLGGIALGALGSIGAGYGVASQLYGMQLTDRGLVFLVVA
ncbi:MAG TPA: ABC transporter permease, partial [Opitutaceae bacterium]|nr:ABC transporter permease [Opitutaceae bacterium]